MDADIPQIVAALNDGACIILPVEGHWSLACNATLEAAVIKLQGIKGSSDSENFTILVNSDRMLNHCVEEVPSIAWDIIDESEASISIIYPKGKNLPPELLAEDGSIAVRYLKGGFCNDILNKLRNPLAISPANFQGEKSPSSRAEISRELIKKVDLLAENGKESPTNSSSSTIKLGLKGEVQIIRF